MKIIKVEQKTPEWLEARRGKVTGTVLKRIVGGAKARDGAFYEVLAERLAVSDGFDVESALDRGVRLESEAREMFERKHKKIVEEVGFVQSDTDPNMGYSPDGLIRKGKKYPEEVGIKCLSSANHVRVWLTDTMPDEHMPQVIQSFIVNEGLQTFWAVFYDPRIKQHPLHVIRIDRKDVADLVKAYEEIEREFLAEVERTLSKIIKL